MKIQHSAAFKEVLYVNIGKYTYGWGPVLRHNILSGILDVVSRYSMGKDSKTFRTLRGQTVNMRWQVAFIGNTVIIFVKSMGSKSFRFLIVPKAK